MSFEQNSITTVPNQRTIRIHKEDLGGDFLGINNKVWKEASCNLRPHALLLYLYLACNRDNFSLALSPAAINNQIGMARSTYHDQFNVLVNKGYLVPAKGNTYDFYEVPRPRDGIENENVSASTVLSNENSTNDDKRVSFESKEYPDTNREIYNKYNINNSIDNENTIAERRKSARVRGFEF